MHTYIRTLKAGFQKEICMNLLINKFFIWKSVFIYSLLLLDVLLLLLERVDVVQVTTFYIFGMKGCMELIKASKHSVHLAAIFFLKKR